MKNIIKVLFIAFIFICSLCISKNAMNTYNVVPTQYNNTISQTQNNEVYNNLTNNTHKFIIPAHKTTESIILSKKNNNYSSFGGYKNLLIPDSNQFLLLLSYIYNKSRLSDKSKFRTEYLLTEISPNAP